MSRKSGEPDFTLDLDQLRAEHASMMADLAELTHDLKALAALLGTQLGQPFKSLAADIVNKRQTS